MASTAVLLILSSCSTAVIHALIPDHWLPFALLARSEGWSERRTLSLVLATGVLHVLVSILVGGVVIEVGGGAARRLSGNLGASLETLGGGLLIAFGLIYGLWAHRRESRAHHPAEAGSGVGRAGGAAAGPGRDGHGIRVHAHGHLLSRFSRGALTGGALVLVIGVSPCVLLQPILFAAAGVGSTAVLLAAAGFGLCTLITMVAVTWFASRGMRGMRLGLFARYGDLASGLLIAAIGLVVMAHAA